MLFKGKDRDIEIEFEACVDLDFWALPASICFIHIQVGLAGYVFHTLLRILCFQFSWEIWKWSHEATDVNDSIEELFNGQ